MLASMRTTVRLDDGLMTEVKRYAFRHRKTLTAVIEEALRETLGRPEPPRRAKRVKLTTCDGLGPRPGLDLDDTAALMDHLDGSDASA